MLYVSTVHNNRESPSSTTTTTLEPIRSVERTRNSHQSCVFGQTRTENVCVIDPHFSLVVCGEPRFVSETGLLSFNVPNVHRCCPIEILWESCVSQSLYPCNATIHGILRDWGRVVVNISRTECYDWPCHVWVIDPGPFHDHLIGPVCRRHLLQVLQSKS